MKKIIYSIIFLSLFGSQSSYAIEPEVGEVYRVALAQSGLQEAFADKWQKRARRSSLLPQLQIGFVNRIANNVDVDVNENVYVGSSTVNVGPEEGGLSESSDLKRDFVVKAVWNLSELIHSRYELGIVRERRSLMQAKDQLLDRVTHAYYERQRVIKNIKLIKNGIYKLKDPDTKAQLLVELEAKIGEATSILDGMTNGWFNQKLMEK
ncbi:MAG: hypothetical protein ABIE74_10625 [Pseudomonadota bacterium]